MRDATATQLMGLVRRLQIAARRQGRASCGYGPITVTAAEDAERALRAQIRVLVAGMRAPQPERAPASESSIPRPEVCPWCDQWCTGATRADHLHLDRTSEVTPRLRAHLTDVDCGQLDELPRPELTDAHLPGVGRPAPDPVEGAGSGAATGDWRLKVLGGGRCD